MVCVYVVYEFYQITYGHAKQDRAIFFSRAIAELLQHPGDGALRQEQKLNLKLVLPQLTKNIFCVTGIK